MRSKGWLDPATYYKAAVHLTLCSVKFDTGRIVFFNHMITYYYFEIFIVT